MFFNYILTAWRSLLKNRVVSIINIGGLTIGLASAVLAILFAHHELTYEDCHAKADRISRVYIRGEFDQLQWIPTSFGPDGPSLQELFPEVELYSRSFNFGNASVRVGENIFSEENVFASDSSLFSMLTLPFVSGGVSPELNTAVISETIAQRYFGSQDPVGQVIRMNLNDDKGDFLVTGVFEDLPSNTHLTMEIIIPFDFVKRFSWLQPDEYSSTAFITLLQTREGTDIQALSQKVEKSYKIPVDINDIGAFLIPLKEIHMRGTWQNNKGKLLVFLISGFFVLIITSLNYINLTNILFSTRNREVGIRKVNGARQKHVFFQFLTDTLLSTLIAFNLAIVIIKLVLPWFNQLMATDITIKSSANSIGLMLLIFVGTVVLSGVYPALRYSYQRPIALMRPVANTLGSKGRSRWVLTTFQFFLAIIFIQFIIATNRHTNYLDNDSFKKYNADNVICLSGTSWGNLDMVRDELLTSPAIEAVAWGSNIPEWSLTMGTEWKEEGNQTMASIFFLNEDYLDVFDISMIKGRFFSRDFPSDKEQSIVINQLAANELGYDDPIGKRVMLYNQHYNIIGVVESYRSVPPIFDLIPLLIRPSGNLSNFLTIRVNPNLRKEAHEHIAQTLKGFNSDYPVELKYHQDILFESKEAKSYVSASMLMNLFFILTIITSLVGLFGLSLFIAQRHRREVSIRKVFGASIPSIMLRLSKGLILQVFIAIVLATPVAMVLVTGYLSVFPSDFSIGLPFYLMGGGLALLLVLLTVGWQTWRAAMANPAEVLRSE
jgi:ABC-type antimicrobial peptide transport system permease subunit